MTNPLLTPSALPYSVPDWAAIKPEHILPAAREAMDDQRAQWKGIATNPEPATVENTVVAFDKSNDVINRALAPAFTLFSSIGGPELEEIQATLGPELSEHTNAFWLDRRMFERFNSIDLGDADEETRYFVEDTLKKFRLKGIDLPEDEQTKLKEIDSELSRLEILFSQRATKAMDDNALIVESREELAGLSDEQIEGYKQEDGRFRLPLLNFTNQPLQMELTNPATRRALLDASLSRGLGDHDSSDTRQLVVDIAKLRAERAALLGQPHHAQVVAMKGMAADSQNIIDLLTSVARRAVHAVDRERSELMTLVDDDEQGNDLQAGDWTFYQEKLRGQVAVDDAALKPYLALSNVVEKGIFYAAEKLFGITFAPRPDIRGYVDTVQTWEVFDESGEAIGLFQADFYARKGKSGGAWMHSLVDQSRRAGTKPVIMNNANFEEPPAGQELLLTWDQVETVFHEFGHALHGLLSDTYYVSTSGTAVPRDFVELPSQLNEMWAYHPEVLAQYAVHHETGERLPGDLAAKLSASKTFGQGFATTEFVASALLDQAWHQIGAHEVPDPTSIEEFEEKALKDLGVYHELVPPRYRTAYFKHTFGGGYDAGYYSYMWAEVLVADIEQWFASEGAQKGDGGLNHEAGETLRRELLSRGSSRDPMESFTAVRGRQPRAEALLERRGL
ncbi:M3 family metallopeptidase [Flaviflexus huanghaiensis]|uniref:M3 family metallopeptidase n=1 Tax=Flaviflexus huanghaiensis TaxID=1111473 RepID=UPI0015FB5044|nr:M3 family metallopeptidase [Flaviflexus huanghaiensis]